MTTLGQVYTLTLFGSFRLTDPSGERIEIASKKGIALIAMLAMAKDGEHTRAWLQDRLWGARQRSQAQSSLRRELSVLRSQINRGEKPLLACNARWVKLDLGQCRIDARGPAWMGLPPDSAGEFLEGIDIAGEEGFEEWLRETRERLPDASPWPAEAASNATKPPAPTIDMPQAPTGFSGRPAVAVLRFKNQTGDPRHDYIAEGISEDLTDRLARLRWLPVIARSSSFAAIDAGMDATQAGRHLGAQYVLDGWLRRAEAGLLVAATLADSETGFTLWSQLLPIGQAISQPTLDALTEALVGRLDALIDHVEQRRAIRAPAERRELRDLIWRGRWHMNRLRRSDMEHARALFATALEMDPSSAEALIQATFCLGWSIWMGRQPRADIDAMRRLAQRAILADHEDGRTHMLAGIAELWRRNTAAAHGLLRTAISLNPSLQHAYSNLGSAYILAGEPQDAFEPLLTAIRFSPNDVHLFYPLCELAMANLMLGRWAEATAYADRSLMRRPAYWYAHVIRINAATRAGDAAAARAARLAMMTAIPDFSSGNIDWLPFSDLLWNQFLADGLEGQDEK